MLDRSNREPDDRDENEIASDIVRHTTADQDEDQGDDDGKNPHAVALGRLGGKKGGPARAKTLSKKRRKEIAQNAAKARWEKDKKKGEED